MCNLKNELVHSRMEATRDKNELNNKINILDNQKKDIKQKLQNASNELKN